MSGCRRDAMVVVRDLPEQRSMSWCPGEMLPPASVAAAASIASDSVASLRIWRRLEMRWYTWDCRMESHDWEADEAEDRQGVGNSIPIHTGLEQTAPYTSSSFTNRTR